MKRELVSKSKINFWKIKGVKETLENLFGDDVHVNDDENLRSNNFLFSVIMVFGIIYIIACMICQLFIVCKLYMKINDMLK